MKSVLGTTARVDGGPLMPCQLEIDQESQVFTDDSPRLNPGWTYRDGKGHEHYASGDELPTLFRWTEEVPCDGSCSNWDCEGYSVTSLWCPLCGEHITPTYSRMPRKIVIPGPERWTVRLFGPVNTQEFDVLITTDDAYFHGRATVTEATTGPYQQQVTAVGITELERTSAP